MLYHTVKAICITFQGVHHLNCQSYQSSFVMHYLLEYARTCSKPLLEENADEIIKYTFTKKEVMVCINAPKMLLYCDYLIYSDPTTELYNNH